MSDSKKDSSLKGVASCICFIGAIILMLDGWGWLIFAGIVVW